MEKKIVLNIPEKTYRNLTSLADFYNQDIDQTVIDVLNAVGINSGGIIGQGKEKKRSVGLEKNLADSLQSGFLSADFFQQILRELAGEDSFVLVDFDFSLEDNRFWIHYAGTQMSTLAITSFYLEITKKDYTLSCDSYVDPEKNGEEILDALEENANAFFEELNPKHYRYEVNEDGLTVQYTTDSLRDLPSLRKMSKIVKDILEETAIK